MAIAEGLAAKVGIGLGALGAGATGIYFGGDYLINSLSNYDKALINFLESNPGHDFVFSSSTSESDLTFTSGSAKATISVQVQISGDTNSLFKKADGSAFSTSDNELKEIKKLNNGSWTWECTFTFEKQGGDVDSINDIKTDIKNSILSSDNKGLFGILKKDLSNYPNNEKENGKWTKQELKDIKIEFIKQCGYARKLSENKKINKQLDSDNTVKSTIPTFKFTKDGSNNHLIPTAEDKYLFESWFKLKYGTNVYKTS